MRTRIHDWLDAQTDTRMFGLQVWDTKNKKRLHVLDDNGPCIYKTEKERDLKRLELRKKRPAK